jgi:hypothetical protein
MNAFGWWLLLCRDPLTFTASRTIAKYMMILIQSFTGIKE